MRFFGSKGEDKDKEKEEPKPGEPPRSESQRLAAAKDPKAAKRPVLRSFVVGLTTPEKLSTVPSERFEEGLRTVLPKGTKVARVEWHEGLDALRRGLPGRESLRFFEVTLPALEVADAVGILQEKGLLDGQVDLALEQCVVVMRASGRLAGLAGNVEAIDRFNFRYDIRCESHEVLVQYPPLEVHKRWLADDDYRAAYGRWRTQRCEDQKPPRWHSGWPPATADEIGPPWIRVRAKDGKPDEFPLEFDDKVLLRFAFQGAEITIMRFNLKVLSNKLTHEFAVYRSLPLSLDSIPKDVQDRMNREPDRFRPLREAGKFGAQFDLVRQSYEELGGDCFHIEAPPAPTVRPDAPIPLALAPVPLPSAGDDTRPRPDPFESGLMRRELLSGESGAAPEPRQAPPADLAAARPEARATEAPRATAVDRSGAPTGTPSGAHPVVDATAEGRDA